MKSKEQNSIFVVLLLISLSFLYYCEHEAEYSQYKFNGCKCQSNITNREFCLGEGNVTKIEALSSSELSDLYNRMMLNIQCPSNPSFIRGNEDSQLEVVLMEMKPSESKWLVPAIYNIGNVYGNQGVAFTVVHHGVHTPILNEVKKDFKGMRLIEVTNGSFSISDYNVLLSSPDFWNNFQTKFTLITQTDVMIIKPVEEDFYNYDLIGAPWPHKPCPYKKEQVGNGGYTLRNNTKMREVTGWAKNDGSVPEDVWWCLRVPNTPTEELAKRFSVEGYDFAEDYVPTGAHKLYGHRGAFNSAGHFFRAFQKTNRIEGCLTLN